MKSADVFSDVRAFFFQAVYCDARLGLNRSSAGVPTAYTNAALGGTDTFASVFGTSGAAMNGTWSLYIVDDLGGDFGTMAGWKLTFEANDFACSLAGKTRADFDGDGKTDLSVFRPSDSNWYLQRTMAGFAAINWGLSTDTLVPGDYDGDRKTDVAVFRPSNTFGVFDFFVFRSSDNTFVGMPWGVPNDIPTVADYDGDGKDDQAVYGGGTWYINGSMAGFSTVFFGNSTDKPVPRAYFP